MNGYSNFELPKRRELQNKLLGKNLPKRHVGTGILQGTKGISMSRSAVQLV
jgi:hypothetical protein